MMIWSVLLLAAFAEGGACGLVSRTNTGLLAGAVTPVLSLLGVLLYSEFFVPYSGGGASMWPVALIFGGVPAAVGGLLGAWAMQGLRARRVASRLHA